MSPPLQLPRTLQRTATGFTLFLPIFGHAPGIRTLAGALTLLLGMLVGLSALVGVVFPPCLALGGLAMLGWIGAALVWMVLRAGSTLTLDGKELRWVNHRNWHGSELIRDLVSVQERGTTLHLTFRDRDDLRLPVQTLGAAERTALVALLEALRDGQPVDVVLEQE